MRAAYLCCARQTRRSGWGIRIRLPPASGFLTTSWTGALSHRRDRLQLFRGAFTIDYDLPNLTVYAETCAAIGLVFFSQRTSLLEQDSAGKLPARRVLP